MDLIPPVPDDIKSFPLHNPYDIKEHKEIFGSFN
jgi:hypothetical protein